MADRPYKTDNPVAVIETALGKIAIELFPREAPGTVENFTKLIAKGYYDGIIFHRVIPGFMIQTGDPTGTGRGGPGYTIKDEFHPKLRHDKAGIVSMAKTAAPDTGGSQFFITHGPTEHLDDLHSVFGQVIEGLDVVQKIGAVKRGPGDRPVTPVKMERVVLVQPLLAK
jgi:cyclophilin family peptidyl-prolyl cis-trans isomerase